MKIHLDHRQYDVESLPPSVETEPSEAPAWEMIEPGRYRPRRIRGSYRGRELG
jgi:hypothetical protein